jgi:hypothetical protein
LYRTGLGHITDNLLFSAEEVEEDVRKHVEEVASPEVANAIQKEFRT